MRTAGTLLALGISLYGMVLAAGQEPAGRVAQLIDQLGSSRFTERVAATQALEALGSPALDSLRYAARSPDLEIRRRAEELIGKIELRQESTRLLAGKKLRLGYRDCPVKQAWADFEKKANLSLKLIGSDLPGGEERTITLETGEVGFWEAVQRFSNALGLVPGPLFTDTTPPILHLYRSQGVALPTCYAGGLRIRALETHVPGWGRTPGVVDVPCVLEVLPEPGIAWQGLLDVRIHRAVDDRDQLLEPSLAGWENPFFDGYDDDLRWGGLRKIFPSERIDTAVPGSPPGQGQQVTVKLKLPKQPSRQIREFQGTLVGQVQTPVEAQLTIQGVLQALNQSFKANDGSVLKVGQVRRIMDGPTQIDVEYEAPLEESVLFNWGINNRRLANQLLIWRLKAAVKRVDPPLLEVQDALGRALEIVRYNEANQFNGPKVHYSATLHVLSKPGAGEPARLLLLGRRLVTVEAPFTLKDVPLP